MKYSIGEEIANSVTHGIGVIFSIVVLTIMIVFSSFTHDAGKIISVIIYGLTLIILYTMSTLYHSFTNKTAKKVFQIFDHSSIYLLIAGTYTPYMLGLLCKYSIKGTIILILVWVFAIFGVVMSAVFPKKFKILNVISYLLMGWCIVFALPELIHVMTDLNIINGLYWLAAGGLFYTIGVIFYAMKNVKYMHFIWHLFVMFGTVCHFISIMFYII